MIGAVIAASAALPSFAAAKSVTLSATGYTDTETIPNFQMLVKLSEGVYGYSYADSETDGSDIWFEDSSGNVIPSEIDTWNADGESFVWVKVPSLYPVSSGATSIVMHWGDLASKQTTSDKMWTGFAGVWHMGNVSGTTKEPDKTGNGLDAQPQTSANSSSSASATTMNTASGVVGKSRINSTTTNNRNSLFVPDYSSAVADSSVFTISGWWSANASSQNGKLFTCGETWANRMWYGYIGNASGFNTIPQVYSGGSQCLSNVGVDSFNKTFVYFVFVYDGTTVTVYSNGRQVARTTSATANKANTYGFAIGGVKYGALQQNSGWNGWYDEVRMYDGAQSANRVKADYDTMHSPHAFLTMSATGTYTLTGDTDWLVPGDGAIIDMNGHNLTLADGFGGAAMITNSAAGEAKELRVSFASATANTATAIGGNLVFVKDGAGTFTSSMSQSYTGGTIVAAGTAQPVASMEDYDAAFTPFGAGDITVSVGATFVVQSTKAYTNAYVLAGGTLNCNKTGTSTTTRSPMVVLEKLISDSALNIAARNMQPQIYGGAAGGLIDLGGNTLTVTMSGTEDYFVLKSSFSEDGGKVIVNAGHNNTYLTLGADVLATNVDFVVASKISQSGTLSVRDYEQTGSNANNQYGGVTKGLYVYGTFTPSSDYFYGCQMMDGSTIDLSAKSGAWNSMSSITSSNKGWRWVRFADAATVYVKVGDRAIDKYATIVEWNATTKPSNLASLRFVFADGPYAGRELYKRSSGLVPFPRGMIISFH